MQFIKNGSHVIAFLVFASLFSIQSFAKVGTETGNAGDQISQEFTRLGQEAIKYLNRTEKTILTDRQKQDFRIAVQKTNVTTSEKLTLNGSEVDAVNYPEQGEIVVSRSRWMTYGPNSWANHFQLVLHEYLWMAKIDDSQYQVSNPLYQSLVVAKERWLKTPIAVALKEAACLAVAKRDRETLQQALEMGADIDGDCESQRVEYKCPNGAIIEANVYAKAPKNFLYFSIQRLVEGNRLCNRVNTPGLAIEDDKEVYEIIELILSFHPNVNKEIKYNIPYEDEFPPETILSSTIFIDKNFKIFRMLLKNGADPSNALNALLQFPFEQNRMGLDLYQEIFDLNPDLNRTFTYSSRDITIGGVMHKAPPPRTYTLSAILVTSDRFDVVKLFSQAHRIDFCQLSQDPMNQQFIPKKKVIDIVRPEYMGFIESVGGLCVP